MEHNSSLIGHNWSLLAVGEQLIVNAFDCGSLFHILLPQLTVSGKGLVAVYFVYMYFVIKMKKSYFHVFMHMTLPLLLVVATCYYRSNIFVGQSEKYSSICAILAIVK